MNRHAPLLAALLLGSCATHAPHAAHDTPSGTHLPPETHAAGAAAHGPSAVPGAPSSASRAAAPDEPAWAAPDLPRLLAVQDGRTGAPLSWDALLDALAGADAVFLGESHTDGTTHRVELGVYDGLLARRGGRVVLAMEMFERDVQPALDDYLAGRIDEPAFLAASRPWGNYAVAYRPLIERARTAGRPIIASNFPRPLRMRMAKDGPGVVDELRAAGSREVPAELLPNTDAYWRRVDNAVRGHKGMMGGDDSPEGRLLSTQSLWDNSMGEACARALDEHPGDLVLHVNGGFHSQYHDGTARQLQMRKPGARLLTVAIVPTDNPGTADVGGLPVADYVVFAARRSEDMERGEGAVFVSRKVGYRLHLPPHASDAARVPLLIWLGDDGLTADDGLQLWKQRLGDEAAIAVIDAPGLEQQDDLERGGRWFTPDDFMQDIDGVRLSIERVWALLLQQQPIDPARVCLAGEGAGATAVAATALLTDDLSAHCVALAPRQFASIRDIPLPLPEDRGDVPRPDTTLAVLLDANEPAADGASGAASDSASDDATWWRTELAEYAGVGLPGTMPAANDDPWQAHLRTENALRVALGLPASEPPASATSAADNRRYVLVEGASPRGRHWARLFALAESARSGQPVAVLAEPPPDISAQRVPLAIRPADFAADDALPLCPGDFGGTTVIVLPAGIPVEDAVAWRAIATADPINKRSRFHRLRVATSNPGDLSGVLTELADAHRTNVLIVPAIFHADGKAMRALQETVHDIAGRLTLHWLPGLGGSMPPPAAASGEASPTGGG